MGTAPMGGGIWGSPQPRGRGRRDTVAPLPAGHHTYLAPAQRECPQGPSGPQPPAGVPPKLPGCTPKRGAHPTPRMNPASLWHHTKGLSHRCHPTPGLGVPVLGGHRSCLEHPPLPSASQCPEPAGLSPGSAAAAAAALFEAPSKFHARPGQMGRMDGRGGRRKDKRGRGRGDRRRG